MQNVSRSYLILSGFSIFILAILYDKVFKNAEKEYCVNADCSKVILKNNLRLSTKTPYRAVQNDIVEEIIFTGCYPNKLWGLFRHGTRTSKNKHRNKVTKLSAIRDTAVRQLLHGVTEKDGLLLVNEITKWHSHEDFNDGFQTLTNEGEREMFLLGRRYYTRFRSVFDDSYINKTYIMRFTNTQRTNSSAYYFASGIFDHKNGTRNGAYNMELMPNNTMIRFYKDCQKWRRVVKKNVTASLEQTLFVNSTIMKSLVEHVSLKLGYKPSLPFETIHLIYMTCAYETAWRHHYDLSPWCKVFNDTEFQIMEYFEDLKYYYIDGYGHSLNTQLPCVLFQNVLQYLMSNDNAYKSAFYFTHSGTILKFLAYLGLYRDTYPLKHDNMHQMNDRLWRTSKIDAFSTNIVFVSYMCGDKQYILSMHQERPVILPGCPTNSYLCPASTVYEIYRNSLTNCDLDEMCSM